jgi:hypothetical protein
MVYCHLAEPNRDVEQGSMGRVLGFLSYGGLLGREELDRAAEQLHKWNEEFEDFMRDIPSSERHQSNDARLFILASVEGYSLPAKSQARDCAL